MATSRAFTQLNAGNETSMDAARQLMSRAAEGAAKGPRRVKMTALPIAERTKSGWLDKKSTGMMAKTHPWDKRYCVWENNQFSLYVRQGDTKPQSIIPLRDMRKVLPVRVKPESKHQFRFELQTVEKSYTLCADNRCVARRTCPARRCVGAVLDARRFGHEPGWPPMVSSGHDPPSSPPLSPTRATRLWT